MQADIKKQNKTQHNWSVFLDGASSLSLEGTGARTVRKPFRNKSCCMALPPVVSASKLMLSEGLCFNHCLVLGICLFEKVQVQLLDTSDRAKKVKLSWHFRVS